jgi:hypothetical protein
VGQSHIDTVISNKNEIKSEIKNEDKLTLFFKDYNFFSIKNSKTPLYAIYNTSTGKIYLKGRIGFIDDLYYMLKDAKYKEGYNTLLDLIKFTNEKKSSDRALISVFLDGEDKINQIDDTIFKPVEKRIVYEDNCKYLNEFSPTKYLKKSFINGCKDGEIFLFIKRLLLNICANDNGAYEYLLKVLSLSIRKPWVKRHGYIVFQGEGASGKGSFFELIMKPIFENYLIVDTEEILRTNFNGYSFDKLWVFIEEKDDSQNKNKGSVSATLKTISGNQKGVSERKGFDRKDVTDYRNFGMTTNKTANVGLNLEKNDRRATIFGYSNALGGSIEKAPAYRNELAEEIPKELDNFVSYLKNMEYNENEVFTCYDNEARRNLIEIDMTNTDKFIQDIQNYSGDHLETIIKDYGFFDKINKNVEFNENEKKYNMNVFFKDKTNEQEFYILLSTIYDLFRKYCENNNIHPLGYNKFSTEFSYNTRLKSLIKTIKGQKKKLFNLKEVISFFNLTFDEKSDFYNMEEIKSK